MYKGLVDLQLSFFFPATNIHPHTGFNTSTVRLGNRTPECVQIQLLSLQLCMYVNYATAHGSVSPFPVFSSNHCFLPLCANGFFPFTRTNVVAFQALIVLTPHTHRERRTRGEGEASCWASACIYKKVRCFSLRSVWESYFAFIQNRVAEHGTISCTWIM